MNNYRSAAFGFAMTAFCSIASFSHTASAVDAMMSDGDHKMMSACLSMSNDNMMKDAGCVAMMKRTNMSSRDITKMEFCTIMSHDAMMKDASCSAMDKLHPGMM